MTCLENHQWIYDLVAQPDEIIYHTCDEWLLARDKHPGTDTRFLIIFKDRSLRTLRDLRDVHLPLLRDARNTSYKTLANCMGASVKDVVAQWRIYFHYYPSVFQLHAHIVNEAVNRNADRVHDLRHVMRNLATDSLWYYNATILCTQTRFLSDVLGQISAHHSMLWARFSKSLLRIELNIGAFRKTPTDPVETNLPGDADGLPHQVSSHEDQAKQKQDGVTTHDTTRQLEYMHQYSPS